MDTIREQLIFPILVCSTLKLKLSKLLMSSRKVNLCTTLICFIGSFGSWVMSQFNKADEHRQPLRADAGSHFFIQDRRVKALYLCSNVFSTKVVIGDTIFTSPTGGGTGILRVHRPNHTKALPFARQKAVPSFLGVSGVLSEVGMSTCSVGLFVRVYVLQNFVFYAVRISPAAC